MTTKRKGRKANPKEVIKKDIMALVAEALANAGFEASDGEDFGMTRGTLIVHTETCDLQLKPIVPKAGVERYERQVEEVEEEEEKEEKEED